MENKVEEYKRRISYANQEEFSARYALTHGNKLSAGVQHERALSEYQEIFESLDNDRKTLGEEAYGNLLYMLGESIKEI